MPVRSPVDDVTILAGTNDASNDRRRAAGQVCGSKCHDADISTFASGITMLNRIDFFHPNASGQTALAARAYPERFTR